MSRMCEVLGSTPNIAEEEEENSKRKKESRRKDKMALLS